MPHFSVLKMTKSLNPKPPVHEESLTKFEYCCESCQNNFVNIWDASNYKQLPEYIMEPLPATSAREIVRKFLNSLTFFSKMGIKDAVIDFDGITDYILEVLQHVEPYGLGFFVNRGSVFKQSKDTANEIYTDGKKRIVCNLCYELSKFILNTNLSSEPDILDVWSNSWANNLYYSTFTTFLENGDQSQSLRDAFFEFMLLICPYLESDKVFKAYKVDIKSSSCSGIHPCPEKPIVNDRRLNAKLLNLDSVGSKVGSAPQSLCIRKKPRPIQPNIIIEDEIVYDKELQKITRNKIKRQSSLSNSSTQDKSSRSEELLKDSGISSLNPNESIFKTDKPYLARLTYFCHDEDLKTCICSIDGIIPSRHLSKGFYADIIVLICNFRVGIQTNIENKNIYESFLICYPFFINGNDLVTKLTIRCISLFPHQFKCPSLQFKGSLFVLLDILSGNRDFIKRSTFKTLWTLFFLLISVGRFTWAKNLRKIIFRLGSENNDNYTLQDINWRIKKMSPVVSPQIVLYSNMRLLAFEILNFDPREICEQITIIQKQLYHKVTPSLFIAYTLEKPLPSDNPVSLVAKNFENIVKWIIALVLATKKPDRDKIVDAFFTMGYYSLSICNFILAKAVVTAFMSNELFREKDVQKKLSALKDLENAMDSSHNYENYRVLIKEAKKAWIPILFVHDNDIKKISLRYQSSKRSPRLKNQETIPQRKSACSLTVNGEKENTANNNAKQKKANSDAKENLKISYESQSNSGSYDEIKWINFELYYDIRTYINKYRLFQFTNHYNFSTNLFIIRAIDDFKIINTESRYL